MPQVHSEDSSSASDLQGSGNGVRVLRVVPGTNATRKGATSVSSSNGDPLGGRKNPCWAPSRHGDEEGAAGVGEEDVSRATRSVPLGCFQGFAAMVCLVKRLSTKVLVEEGFATSRY